MYADEKYRKKLMKSSYTFFYLHTFYIHDKIVILFILDQQLGKFNHILKSLLDFCYQANWRADFYFIEKSQTVNKLNNEIENKLQINLQLLRFIVQNKLNSIIIDFNC